MPNRLGKELSLAKNVGYGSIKNVTLHLNSKITLSSICKPCQDKPHDNLDNVWVEFPFDDDFFRDKETASFDEKINDDAYKTNPVADWKAFNKRGLHMIRLNINSLLSKIDKLREIARKTRATVIGITESKLDGSVLDGEINIDGYELVRSDQNRHGGGGGGGGGG